MKKDLYVWLWFTMTSSLYGFIEWTIFKEGKFEASIAFLVYLNLLTFPSGVVVSLFWYVVTFLLGKMGLTYIFANGHTENFLLWISFTYVGYLQWFIAIPVVWKRFFSKSD
ncbi:hypothetical protein [Bdellovibrio bacteriovorus]|uniref:hypothetical protein n=1 Tax=Bdellovibrio bacteriovorus TaxID=959 RepID=UPI003CFD7AC8